MNDTFNLHRAAHELFDSRGLRFDALTRTWLPDTSGRHAPRAKRWTCSAR